MSEMTTIERDTKGRFLTGGRPGPGRAKGSRNKLATDFLDAFADDFEKHGAAVIAQVRVEKPDVWLKIAADLLPKQAQLDVTGSIEVGNFAQRFREAVELLGNAPPRMKTIEHDHARKQR